MRKSSFLKHSRNIYKTFVFSVSRKLIRNSGQEAQTCSHSYRHLVAVERNAGLMQPLPSVMYSTSLRLELQASTKATKSWWY